MELRQPLIPVLAIAFCASLHAADPYAEAARYAGAQARDAVVAIEADIRAAKPEQLPAIEAKLLKIIQGEATPQAKGWACRTLRIAGSEQAIPVLVPLLKDKDLAADAQYALRCVRGPKVDEALRGALADAQGLLKAGIVKTLGARGDKQAVAVIAPLASGPDAMLAEAALYALGQVGGADALKAAQGAKAPDALKRYREHAILLCAESVLAEGKNAEAAAAYRGLYASDDLVTKQGALRGIVSAEKAKAAPLLSDALHSASPRLGGAAAKALCELGDGELLTAVLAGLPSCPPDAQIVVLGLLNDPAGLAAAREAAGGGTEDVRVAALGAVGRIGDASVVPLLIKTSAGGPAPLQAAARKSLSSLRGAGVSEALLAAAQSGESAARAEAIQALAARNATSAVGALLKLASDADAGLRTQALTALASLAQAKDVPALVDLFMQSKTDADRSAAENALAALARRVTDKDAAAAPLLEALAKAPAPQRPTLLRLASRVPCAKSLEVLRSGLKEADAAAQDAAVRGLVDWPDAAALPALAEIARSFADQTHRVLALRGFIRIAALQDGRTPEQRVKALAEAMPLAASAAEKKLVLAALGDFSTVAALDLATGCLAEKELEVEAATAVVNIAKRVQKTNAAAAAAARQKILDVCTSPAARQIAEGPSAALTGMVNIAPQGTASSPDGLKDDGASSGPQAAIDGDSNTYWDQEDGAKLYRLVVTFKQPEKFAAISIMGHEQHSFAPKDFEILGDGKAIKAISNAQYQDNLFVVRFDQTECKAVELKITGYYGGSPAVRELGIYRSAK